MNEEVRKDVYKLQHFINNKRDNTTEYLNINAEINYQINLSPLKVHS